MSIGKSIAEYLLSCLGTLSNLTFKTNFKAPKTALEQTFSLNEQLEFAASLSDINMDFNPVLDEWDAFVNR